MRNRSRKRDGERERERERERGEEREGEGDTVTHSSHAASSFDYSSKGGWKLKHFCTLTLKSLALFNSRRAERKSIDTAWSAADLSGVKL